MRYLDRLVSDTRGHLENAQAATATASAWIAIMVDRQNDERGDDR